MEVTKPKKRTAKWASCKWCQLRGLPIIFRSGKRKCLERHMVECQKDYVLEKEATQTSVSARLLQTVEFLTTQVADLQARVKILELKKDRYYVERDQYWSKLTPKLCWKRAKENTIRFLSAALKTYCENPLEYYADHWEWLENYYISPKIELNDILSMALWPVLTTRENRTVLRGVDSCDHFHMFKRVWGKAELPDIGWYKEALQEMKLPSRLIDEIHLQNLNCDFQRMVIRYQSSKQRNDQKWIPQGIVALVKTWEKMSPIPAPIFEVCTSLEPKTTLMWET